MNTDASSSNEAVHLQQRLKNLSTELVTLRNRLHVDQPSQPIESVCPPNVNGTITSRTGLGINGNGGSQLTGSQTLPLTNNVNKVLLI